MLSRREFVRTAACAAAGLAAAPHLLAGDAGPAAPRIRVSSCSVGGFADAKAAGLEGIELNAGGADDVLSIAKPENRAKHKEQMKETGVAVSSIMMGLFNSCPLASDPRGPAWLEQTIEAAGDLGVQVILVAFFGKGSLLAGKELKKDDVDVVVQRIKAAAPKARAAGTILGIENTVSAQQNAEILDRIGHESVRIYYDSYNLAGQGYDVPAEIRMLKDRIAIHHFKNGSEYLETGKVKFEPVAAAIKEVGYRGWIVLETSSPSKDRVADAKKNAEYIRKLFA